MLGELYAAPRTPVGVIMGLVLLERHQSHDHDLVLRECVTCGRGAGGG